MVILRATSILVEQKEDKGMMCSITQVLVGEVIKDSKLPSVHVKQDADWTRWRWNGHDKLAM
jgi:alpha-D-ribose 1-methylphosphonate 5-phosphate C-P lyase